MVSIEGINDEWILKSTRQVKLLDSHNNALKNTAVSPSSIYVLGKEDGEKVFVFTEPITEDRQVFTKYLVKEDVDLTIGRTEQMNVCYSNKVVSSKHALLSYRNGKWFIQDTNSTNGTFVNETRVQKAELNVGRHNFHNGFENCNWKKFCSFQ